MQYFHIKIKIKSDKKVPYFTGSMLRGAFGYALKKVTCINPSYNCEGCFAQSTCLYYDFYEQKNSFHKYRFDIALGSGRFDFGLYLFEDLTKLPYILSALDTMLTKQGLTKENDTFNQVNISVNDTEVYKNGEFLSLDIALKTFKLDSFCPDIKIKLQTPIRMKKNNKFLRNDIAVEDILRSIYQREQEIYYEKKVFKLDYTPSYKTIVKALHYKSLIRNSQRQKTKMNMDGIVGEIAIIGLDEKSYRLLKLGEIIGVGKQTVMGLGKIKIEEIK